MVKYQNELIFCVAFAIRSIAHLTTGTPQLLPKPCRVVRLGIRSCFATAAVTIMFAPMGCHTPAPQIESCVGRKAAGAVEIGDRTLSANQ